MTWAILLLSFHSGQYAMQVHPSMSVCSDFLKRMYDKEVHSIGQCIDTEYPSGVPIMPWVAPPPPRPEELK